jgi:hypothetical protein
MDSFSSAVPESPPSYDAQTSGPRRRAPIPGRGTANEARHYL